MTAVANGSSPHDLRSLREVTDAATSVLAEPAGRRAALAYLRQRGVDADQLSAEWVLGYAPPGWTRLVDRLRSDFSDEALLEAGVARRSSRDTLIDAFRDRVIFGINGEDGHVAGFIGRDLSGQSCAPKYLNTRHHALFEKGHLLFGLHEGMSEWHGRQPVLVEGPMDVLAVAAHARTAYGVDLLPIAPCGTALTAFQSRRIAEIACEQKCPVVVAMDGDGPGRAAALTAGRRLREFGVDVRVATMPSGADPAEFLASGGGIDVFHASSALPLINLQVESAVANQGDRMQWVEGRLAALRSVAPELSAYPSAYISPRVGWLSQAFHLDMETVMSELPTACASVERSAAGIEM